MAIEWEEIIRVWEPSDGGAQLIEDAGEIQKLKTLIDYISGPKFEYESILLFGPPFYGPTAIALNSDQIDKKEFFGLLSEQFVVHKKIWKTHLQDRYSDAYETFFYKSGEPNIRYCKFLFSKNRNPLNGPTNLQNVSLDYHPNTREIKVEIRHEEE